MQDWSGFRCSWTPPSSQKSLNPKPLFLRRTSFFPRSQRSSQLAILRCFNCASSIVRTNILHVTVSTMLSRTMRASTWMRLPAAAAVSSCAVLGSKLQIRTASTVRNADYEIAPESVGYDADGASRAVSARSSILGSACYRNSRSISTRALSSGSFWKREGGVHRFEGIVCRSFSAGPVASLRSERNGSFDPVEGSSSSGSAAVRPVQPSHIPVADDLRTLIASKKREVAILEAALEVCETAPRDTSKWSVNQQERRSETPEPPLHQATSPKPMLGDLVVKPNIELEPASTLELPSQIMDSSNNDFVEFETAKASDNQQDRRWHGKLPLDNFLSPQDPNLARLQKKRRRQELMKEHERNSKIQSLNSGAAAKNAVGGPNPREESRVNPLRPNANVFLELEDNKPRKSLAERLYEEHFGHPAPPGLKRTYPKGSYYDKCMKEKERKEREAAAAAARVVSPSPPKSFSSPSIDSSGASARSQRDETSDNVTEGMSSAMV